MASILYITKMQIKWKAKTVVLFNKVEFSQ